MCHNRHRLERSICLLNYQPVIRCLDTERFKANDLRLLHKSISKYSLRMRIASHEDGEANGRVVDQYGGHVPRTFFQIIAMRCFFVTLWRIKKTQWIRECVRLCPWVALVSWVPHGSVRVFLDRACGRRRTLFSLLRAQSRCTSTARAVNAGTACRRNTSRR